MARDVESLVLRMSADLRRFEKSMDAMRQTADRRLNDVEKRALKSQRNLSRTMGNAGRDMVSSLRTSLAGIAPVIAGAFSAAAVLKYADAYTSLQNRLKATGLEGAALKRVEDSLYESANRNGVAVAATAELYQRAAMARENLGATEEQLLKIVSGTSAALKLQGTSATEASGALLQLGQLLGGNMVQAQEYNSLIDQLPTVLEAVAKGSERWGGSVNKLTLDVKAGTVTVQEWAAAMLKGFADIEARAASATPTLGAAFQTLNNEIGKYVGQTDSGLSATARMATAIQDLAMNLDRIVPIIGVLAALIGTKMVLALTANSGALIANGLATIRLAGFQTAMTASLTGTTTATVVATGAMARLNAMMAANPVGLLLVSFAALAGAIVLIGRVTEGAVPPTQALTQANHALRAATDAYREAADAAAIATGAEAAVSRELAAAKREEAAAKRDSAQATLAETRALIAKIGLEARSRLANETFNFRGDRAGTTNPISNADRERVRQARADAAAAEAAIQAANSAISQADAALRRRPPSAGALAGGPRGGGGGGASRADAAAAQARAEAAEREREATEARRLEEEMIDALAAAGERRTAARVAGREHEAALLRDQLETTAELARLAGDPAAAAAAERELWINERINELLSLRPELSAAARRALAEGEAGAREAAGRTGEERTRAEYDGREMARSFVDVLAADDIWDAAGRRFREAAFDNLEDLLSELFTAMRGGDGGGIFAGLGNALKGLIPGFASGTASAPGGLAYVHKGELLANLPKGTSVIPAQVVRAMANMPSRASGGASGLVVSINLDGANGDAAIRQISRQAAMEGTMAAIAQSRMDTAKDRQAARYRTSR